MRLRSIFSEAYRNLVTGTTRAVLFGILLAAVSAGLAITDARSIIDIEHRAAAFVASGASTSKMVAENTTDAAACERLSTIPGVRSAGALKEADAVVLRTMVANPISAFTVTPGFISLLGGDAATGAGAWIPVELARTLGVEAGQQLATTAGTMSIAGVYRYPDDGRDSRLAYAALLPAPAAGDFDECWADIWPLSPAREDMLHSALRVDTGSLDPVEIGQVNTRFGTEFNGAEQFAHRPTRYALPGCVLVGLLLGFVAVRVRRLEIAGALHLGQSRRDLVAVLSLEAGAWAALAVVLAAVALVFGVIVQNPSDPMEVYLIDLRGPAAAGLAAVIGAILASCTVQEKHLFAYFKDR